MGGLCSLPVVLPEAKLWWGNGSNGNLLQKASCWGSWDCYSQCPDPKADHCWPTPLSETPGHSQASMAQSLVGSLLLFSGTWCSQGFVVPFKSLFPWEFSVLLLDSQVRKSVVGLRTFTTVHELLWCNCSPICGLSAWRLYGGASSDLLQEEWCHMPHLPGLLLPMPLSPWQVTVDSCLHRRH